VRNFSFSISLTTYVQFYDNYTVPIITTCFGQYFWTLSTSTYAVTLNSLCDQPPHHKHLSICHCNPVCYKCIHVSKENLVLPPSSRNIIITKNPGLHNHIKRKKMYGTKIMSVDCHRSSMSRQRV
jgi:hypothetical protein